MGKGLEHLTDVERLRVLGLLSLEKRWPGGGLNIRKYPKGGCKQDGARLFLAVPRARTRGSGQKVAYGRLCLNTRSTSVLWG